MARWIIRCALLAVAGVALLNAGCGEKTTTVERSERIEESEPQPVSPGEEVIE